MSLGGFLGGGRKKNSEETHHDKAGAGHHEQSGVAGLSLEEAADLAQDWATPTVGDLKGLLAARKLHDHDFKLLDCIGAGTFSHVRLVRLKHTDDGTEAPPMVLKTMKKQVLLDLHQVEHIKAEVQVLKLCDNPFLVAYLGHWQDARRLCILLEFVHGGELYGRLNREGRLPVDHSKFYAAEISLALQYLHGLNIAYRDIKPENVMVDRSGHIKLVDFGFAKLVGQRKTYTLVGTPEYLAPEIIQSSGHGMPVDLWAFGVLIYEMLSGYPPFYEKSPFDIYKKILHHDITYPRHFDVKAKHLIEQLLKHDPSERATHPDCMYHVWFDFVDWETVRAQAMRPPWRPRVFTPDDVSLFDVVPPEEADDSYESAPAISKAKNEAFLDGF